CGCIEFVIDEHRYAMSPEQGHAVTVGNETERQFPKRRRDQSIAKTQTAGQRCLICCTLVDSGRLIRIDRCLVVHDEQCSKYGQNCKYCRVSCKSRSPAEYIYRPGQQGCDHSKAGHATCGQKEQGHAAVVREPTIDDRGQCHGTDKSQTNGQYHAK